MTYGLGRGLCECVWCHFVSQKWQICLIRIGGRYLTPAALASHKHWTISVGAQFSWRLPISCTSGHLEWTSTISKNMRPWKGPAKSTWSNPPGLSGQIQGCRGAFAGALLTAWQFTYALAGHCSNFLVKTWPPHIRSFWQSPSSSQCLDEPHGPCSKHPGETSVAPLLWCPTANTLLLLSTPSASAKGAFKVLGTCFGYSCWINWCTFPWRVSVRVACFNC